MTLSRIHHLGYALTRGAWRALTREATADDREPPRPTPPRRVCVVIHAYYVELLDEILALLTPWDVPYRLIITTTPEREVAVRARLASLAPHAECRIHENRGRDVLPFLRVANALADSGEELVLKLHTKSSRHRANGDRWRRDLLTKLAGPVNAPRLHRAFSELPRAGMIAPEGHILTMRSYWGANREKVHDLCRRMGIPQADPSREVFAAGSMYWARLDALRPLLDLRLDDAEFESERGQLDGTMAHAVERCVALAVKRSGLYLASTSQPAVAAQGTFAVRLRHFYSAGMRYLRSHSMPGRRS